MPILQNQRHELFAQEIAKGQSATKAYETAGYRPSRKNASRLRAKDDISARVQELQAACARSAVISIETICRELDEAVSVAKAKGQAQAMVSASTLRAKLAGLLTDRIEVTTVDPYETADSMGDIAALLARDLNGCELTRQQLTEFTALVSGWYDEMKKYLAGCSAKPVEAISPPVRSPAEIERRRLGLARGNGQPR